MSTHTTLTSITLPQLAEMHRSGEKIAVLTAYDASFAALCDSNGVEVIIVGDSLGMVLQGHGSTLPVTLSDIAYHVAAVKRGCRRPLIIADMPFGSFQESPEQAFRNAVVLMSAGAHMVKLEGGNLMVETTQFLVHRGIPVCGHLGLTPQSVNSLGGYKIQGRNEEQAQQLVEDAATLAAAGAGLLVLEAIPNSVTSRIFKQISIPTIGIGAGPECSGQVLVLHDMLGITPGKKARFVKDFMAESSSIGGAIAAYVKAVKEGSYPAPGHCY
ncbi:MAG: 3-methyl-2-oxobutanoate hydroxymethyltransferase [Propionivibrio sp.]|uniref:3-methyl-2-oxobutanoate hydroxymethyltransferase n=1 Tax=Propionivibrio sp. TaxID=2212460 RepID=UPI001A49B961|nr:3-methyl-2-oxobutanoate hydroxymethyltransferase [Propionivibrio sp.]MBL8414012.1 3-methyl-2-oxobutanoate hydroxymethyltransferase [Propionivibrio sp.]